MNINCLFVWKDLELSYGSCISNLTYNVPKCLSEIKNRWVYETDELFIYWEGNIFGNILTFENIKFEKREFWQYIRDLVSTNPKGLANLNGVFHGLFWDKQQRILRIFTDRHGLKPVYYALNRSIAFVSFVSPLEVFSEQGLNLYDVESIIDFIDYGVYWGESTPFKNVKVLDPATVLEIQNKAKFTKIKYWNWCEIRPIKTSLEDSIKISAEFLKKSILNRQSDDFTNLTPLSGGMDSRFIFDVLAQNNKPQECYTFGDCISGDIHVAKKVLKNTGIAHNIVYLEHKNWCKLRSQNSRGTFGFAPFFDLHGYEKLDRIASKNVIIHSGFLGDAILGDTYIKRRNFKQSNVLNREELINKFGIQLFEKHELSDYLGLRHLDYVFIDNSARKNVLYGILGLTEKLDYRLPFFDHELVDFLYGVPEDCRKNRVLYDGVLLELMSLHSRTISTDKFNHSKKKVVENLQKAQLKILRELRIPHASAPLFNYHKGINNAEFKTTLKKGLNFIFNDSGLFSSNESQRRLKQIETLSAQGKLAIYSRILAVFYVLMSDSDNF